MIPISYLSSMPPSRSPGVAGAASSARVSSTGSKSDTNDRRSKDLRYLGSWMRGSSFETIPALSVWPIRVSYGQET